MGTGTSGPTYIEVVHRLTDIGAVVTYEGHGTTPEGFDAEWREISLSIVDGDLINRCEIFDEADLDAALARFDELSRSTPRPENAASRVLARVWAYLAARDWNAMAEVMADDFSSHDRRRVVNAGVRRGRDVHIANMRAVTEVGFENLGSTVIATRGRRLAMSRTHSAVHGLPDEVGAEAMMIVEIDADNRLATNTLFDVDEIEAAFEELDARYVRGEGAAHAQTWSVIAEMYGTLNRREIPAMAKGWVNVDHRPLVTIEPNDLATTLGAMWDLVPDVSMYVEAVHRLTSFGAVVTHTSYGTSQEGFDAEWRMIQLLTVDGDMISRTELFDEADIDAALARFDELSAPARRLENAATRVYERLQDYFLARDWDSLTETLAEDHYGDDRRSVVNAGIQRGRDAELASLQATADMGVTSLTITSIAIRGDRLALCRTRGTTSGPDAFYAELLRIVEINADNQMAARIVFDLDDVDAAFEELDSALRRRRSGRPLANVVGYRAEQRRVQPSRTPFGGSGLGDTSTTAEGQSFEPGDLTAYIRSGWEVAPDSTVYIETVHRVSDLGAVVTQVSKGTSEQGFEAEWRFICLLVVDGEVFSSCELFDEADIDAALVRFEELSRPAPQLENAATRVNVHNRRCVQPPRSERFPRRM